MRLPDFLIIGAMKSGTTSLFFDLATHPRVFAPEDKEPNNLIDDAVLSAAGKAAYAHLFRRAGPEEVCGEASTAYSKLPDVPGVPRRARAVLGPEARAIYLVREPVSRVISQHHHELAAGDVPDDIDRAVREHPRLIDYSRYAMQVRPWLEALGPDRVRIVRFETYIADRPATVGALFEFLGLEPSPVAIEADRVHNPGEALRVRQGGVWRLSRGAFYRTLIRPWLSRSMRDRLRRRLIPKAPPRPAPPALATVDYILDRVADDAETLRRLAGWDEPAWDLAAVRQRFAAGRKDVRG